jgi:phytanoyl-CoA hydroxylase
VNRSGTSRHAYTLHCVSAAAEYPAWNWLQRPADMPLQPLGSGA